MGKMEWDGTDGGSAERRPTRVPVYQCVATIFSCVIDGVRCGRVAVTLLRNRAFWTDGKVLF